MVLGTGASGSATLLSSVYPSSRRWRMTRTPSVGTSVDARKASEEVCAACPRETPYPVSHASTVTLRRTELILSNGFLEGECRHRPSYRGRYVGNPLMWTLQRRLIS